MDEKKLQKLKKSRSAVAAACAQRGLDRRDVIKSLVGKNGASDCTQAELDRVLNHLNRHKQGFQGRACSRPTAERAPCLGKIDALLAELHRVTGKVHTLRYADAISQKFGLSSIDMADVLTLQKVIGALERTLAYARKKEAVE